MEKDDILDAIRRCAAENDGKVPGRERFETLTGIRESDWAGRYWIRWGDAVTEAGLTPNQFNQALAEDDVLRQLAMLTRELGHFPVFREQEMRRRVDKAYPTPTAILRRYGSKQGTINRLHEYCSTQSEFADVAAICEPFVRREGSNVETDSETTTEGYVYLVKSGKHYKIGRSNHAGRRFYEIELQLPEKLTVVHHIKTDDPVGIERYWHERFADKRANGEWFVLTSADVKAFKRRRQFM